MIRGDRETQIKRLRRKNMVYGQFVLWPETVKALDWFQRQRQGVKTSHKDYVILTQTGSLFDRQRIANAWNDLLSRAQASRQTFRRLSFKHLRKTAGQLIRNRADGEIFSRRQPSQQLFFGGGTGDQGLNEKVRVEMNHRSSINAALRAPTTAKLPLFPA